MYIQRKAVALISGGLDSLLAAKMMLDQGIHVEGINFFTGFCVEGHTHALRKQDKDKQKRNNALWVAQTLGIKLHFIDVVEAYKNVVLNPKHGYGAHLNPCLDCKIFMVKHAVAWMEENGFDFIVTGEVIGQRPKSQKKVAMPVVSNQSGAFDRLLRPLCAKRLPETLPEREGWVDREKLQDITGRGRKHQIAMAGAMGLKDFAQPAGGCCFLTDKAYSQKLADLWQHRGKRDYELDDVMLLKVGRHLRPKPEFKMIIGREEGENNFLEGYRYMFSHMKVVDHTGPMTLIDGTLSDENALLAAQIAARYSSGKDESEVAVEWQTPDKVSRVLRVAPLAIDDVEQAWYV